VFGLSSNARMVLNEMVYDPNGSNNSSLLSLVAGTISFVAGETAKHGDMKVDTPVATMGIRGTAVLVEIDFTVPGQGGTPDAKFQVLVEPDGTTGSYILFDKTTLTPLAVVDKAGLQINISNGILSQTMNPLSPEIQKLITDVFSLKFSDNSNPNTNTHFTDSIVPQALPPIKLASGPTATPFILISSDTPINTPISPPPPPPVPHIDQAPLIVASGNFTTAHTGTAKSTGFDTVSGPIRFTDINAGDRPTVTAHFVSLKLMDAQHNDITTTLTSQQMAAVEAQLVVNASPSNNNNGTATWTYNVADSAFDFLTVGETLTLTYDAVVNNNFLPFEQQAEALFTITINGPSIVEWIHPTGDLWSIGSNWNSGTVPTADDDVIIPAEHIPGGSGLYDVSIVAPASARTLTLNANNTTGGQVINHSTLTIGETLTIFNDGVLNNSISNTVGMVSTVSVGGQIELLDQSSILNSGLIKLGQGGDFKDQSSVTNSGTIELAGGTLNVQVDIANSGGIIQVDGDTTLKLNGAAINGGTINDNGPIDVTADSSINGTSVDNGEDGTTTVDALLNGGGVIVESGVTLTLDNVTVSGTIFVDTAAGATIQVDGGTTLTLDDVMVIGGTITDNGTIRVDAETTLKLKGVAINGGTINDNGTIDVTADSSINGTSIDNGEDGTTTIDALLNNGEVTIESDVTLTLDNVTVTGTTFIDTAGGATIQVDGGTTLTLDDVTVTGGTITDNGTIQVDTETTLTLNGVAINGGTINDNGAIDVTADSSINGSATDALLNNGEVTIESDVTLTLDNVTVNGTTFADTAGGAILQVGVGTTLTLEGGATIDGGTINDGTAIVDVKDVARIDSNATLNNGRVTIESGATLTLDDVTVNGTAFTDLAPSSTIQVDDGDTLTLNNASISGGAVTDNGTIDISGAVTFQSGVTVNGGAMSIAKGATLDIENAVTGTGATLNGVNVINSGTIQVDAPGAGTTIISLMLDGGTTVTGGTLLIHVGFPVGSIEGTVEIGTGGATLDHVTVTNNNSLTIDDSNTLTLSHVTINGGIINAGTFSDGLGGTIDVIGDSSINGITADNGDGFTTVNAILNNGEVTVESGVTLTLDNVTVNGTVFTGLDTSSIIQVDDGDTLALNGAAINGGTIIVTGTLDLENATVNGGTLGGAGTIATAAGNIDSTLNGVTIAGGTLVTAAVGTLDLTGIITNNGEIDATTGTLDLESATVNGGTIKVFGVMDSTGISFITNAGITNSGLIESIGGILTIDPVAGPTVVNSGTLEANGGELDITGDPVTNTGILQAIDDSTLKLTTLTVTNTGGTVTVDNGSTLDLANATIDGGTLGNSGTLDSTGISFISNAGITNSGLIESTSGILTIDPVAGPTLTNSGTLEANGGELDITGDPVTNTGILRATDDSTLKLTTLTVTNTGGTVTVDSGSTLDLANATIDDGTLGNSGTLDSTGNSFITNAGITNSGLIESTSGILTIDPVAGPTLTNSGTLEANGGELDITGDPVTNTGILRAIDDSTLKLTTLTVTNTGGTVTVDNGSTLDLADATIDGGTLGGAGTIATAAGNTDSTLNGVTIGSGSKVTAAVGTLDLTGTITNHGEIDAALGGTLDLENTTINGGTLGGAGTIATATGNTDSTLNGVTIASGALVAAAVGTLDLTGTITNHGEIDAAPGGTLDLENATIDGGTLGGAGTIATAAGNTDSTLNGVTIGSGSKVTAAVGTLDLTGVITNHGEIDAAPGGTLDLENVTINGGTLGGAGTIATATGNTDSTLNGVTIASGSKVTAAVGTLDLTGTIANHGEIDAALGGTLDLANVIINGGTLGGAGTIATATGNTDSTLNGVTIGSGSKITAAVGTLDLTGTITNHGEIDAAPGGTLDLENATIDGGTLGGAGTMATVTGNTDSTLNGVTIASGALVAAAVGTLDLTGIITNHGEIDAALGGTLDLENATINGGNLDVFGVMDSSGVSFITGATIVNSGTIEVTSGTLTIDPTPVTNTGTIEVAGDGTLVLSGETISNGVNGKIEVDATGGTLDLENAIINGGTLGGAGTIATAAGNIDSTLNGVTIASGSKVTAAVGTLDLTGVITNHGEIDAAPGGTLDLENVTINGGTLGGAGTIVAVSGDNTLNGVTIANGTKLTTSNLATLDLTGTITNNGEIDATTTKVNIAGNITGTGSIEIFNHAKLEIGGSVSSGQTVTFSAPGDGATLILDDSKDFHGTIVGLVEYPNESQENHVDLKDLTFRSGHMSAHFNGSADTVTVSNGIDSVTLHLSGGPFDPSFELARDATGGTLIDDPSASSGLVTIDSGKTLDISVASTATVSFTNSNGNTGELVLDNSKAFTGQIVGFAGDGTISNSDLIDLADVNIADVAIDKTTYTDNGNGTGTLTLHDANGQTLDSLTFAGNYQLANFTVENDGSGHTLIVDPPASTSPAVSGVVMNDPGPVASSTIVATAANQTLTGLAPSDNFVFNFAGVGHAIVTDFHPATDTLQFGNPIFVNAQAAFDATHDDGHGNSVVAIDAHDTITLAGILKAQLHAGDFHIV
jgi:hypothetical protein